MDTAGFTATANYTVSVIRYSGLNYQETISVQGSNFLGISQFNGFFISNSDAASSYSIVISRIGGTATVVLDTFYAGINKQPIGSAVTDWVSYTPTFLGLGNPPTSPTGRWRRVGDSMEVTVYANYAAGADGQIGFYIPSGYTIDYTKLQKQSYALAGHCVKLSNAAENYYTGSVLVTNVTELQCWASTGQNWTSSGTDAPSTWDTNSFLEARILVPIVGWSSNIQVADTSLVRSIVSAVTKNNNVTGSYVAINWATVVTDAKSEFTASTSTFTAKSNGYYKVDVDVLLDTGGGWAAAEFLSVATYKNTTLSRDFGSFATATNTTYMRGGGQDLIYLLAGEYIQVKIKQNSGADIVLINADGYNKITIEQIPFSDGLAAFPIGGQNILAAATPGLITDTATISASSTLLQYICNKATAFTITLGTAVGFEGNILRFKNIGAGVVTIDGNASETIDGATTTTLSQYQAVSLIAYAGNWYVL